MKDQKALTIKCLKNEWPVFVVAGNDICAIEAMREYKRIAEKKGCSKAFLDDIQELIDFFVTFQNEEPEYIKIPD